jgi:hypothetical protein
MPDSNRPANVFANGWKRVKTAVFNMDSLDSVEVLIAIEEAVGVNIPDADAEAMATPRHVVEWLLPRIGNAAPNQIASLLLKKVSARENRSELTDALTEPWRREQVAAVVREIVVEQTGNSSFDEDSKFRNGIFS